jgi:hypothetical protein
MQTHQSFEQILSEFRATREEARSERLPQLDELLELVRAHRSHERRDDLAAQLMPGVWEALEQLEELERARDAAREVKYADQEREVVYRRRRTPAINSLTRAEREVLEEVLGALQPGRCWEEVSLTIIEEWELKVSAAQMEHVGGPYTVLSRAWMSSARPWADWHQVRMRLTRARKDVLDRTPFANMFEIPHIFGGGELYDVLYCYWERALNDCKMATGAERPVDAHRWSARVQESYKTAAARGLLKAAFELAKEVAPWSGPPAASALNS